MPAPGKMLNELKVYPSRGKFEGSVNFSILIVIYIARRREQAPPPPPLSSSMMMMNNNNNNHGPFVNFPDKRVHIQINRPY